MMRAFIHRLVWMINNKFPRCPFRECRGFATHTWWGYQGDDLRDVDVCWKHSNNRQEVEEQYARNSNSHTANCLSVISNTRCTCQEEE